MVDINELDLVMTWVELPNKFNVVDLDLGFERWISKRLNDFAMALELVCSCAGRRVI